MRSALGLFLLKNKIRKDIKMNVKLITMSDVESTPVNWLWYPYIPYGKITLVQGNPGDGKTTFAKLLQKLSHVDAF